MKAIIILLCALMYSKVSADDKYATLGNKIKEIEENIAK